jgi:hypothetical protein
MSKNVAASIHQRLLNHSKKEGVRFNDVLQRSALERWLYRLSISEHADRFVLKGALMLTACILTPESRIMMLQDYRQISITYIFQ